MDIVISSSLRVKSHPTRSHCQRCQPELEVKLQGGVNRDKARAHSLTSPQPSSLLGCRVLFDNALCGTVGPQEVGRLARALLYEVAGKAALFT